MTKKNSIQFDFDKALEDLKAGKPMSGKDGFLTPMIKQFTEVCPASRTTGSSGAG